MDDESSYRYAGILWAVDGNLWHLYADRNGYMVLAPVVSDDA